MDIIKNFDNYELIELEPIKGFDKYAIDRFGNIWSMYQKKI